MATAVGDVVSYNNAIRAVCLMTGQAVANGAPSGASAGVPNYPNENKLTAPSGASYSTKAARESNIMIKGTGSGTVAGTFRLWGYLDALAEWVPLGVGADTTKGTLNAGNAIGETATDKVLHCEPVLLAGLFTRIYLELLSPSGTTPSFEAWLVTARTVNY